VAKRKNPSRRTTIRMNKKSNNPEELMNFILEGHQDTYEVQTIIQVFYPNENYAVLDAPSEYGVTVLSRVTMDENICYAAVFESGEKVLEKSLQIYDNNVKELKRAIKLSIYDCLLRFTRIRPFWGILTGIRPSKTIREYLLQGCTEVQAKQKMTERFLVCPQKAALSLAVAQSEAAVLNTNDGSSVAVYTGIPFCPTRCSYCSFAAYAISEYQSRGRVDLYIDTLIKELKFIKRYTDQKYLESFYIGGGTPTALNDAQLERLLAAVAENFNIYNTKEFSVEAGRPDTITREKLKLLRKYGVSRISINPQTMQERTLKTIGRAHTVAQFLSAYQLAREEGLENINIDLILGLPGETAADVNHTMTEIEKLCPVSVTVHTLAIKRASELKRMIPENDRYRIASADEMEQMLEISSSVCRTMGLKPYYMYRQKNSSGNFENVGYAKKGFECVYNVQIMGERQTIIAAGAGAVSKIVSLAENRIERVFNVKNVDEYITRIDEMLDRKQKGVIL
jgi:oxygen-independent coproporphyrinogen-3 oxidase